MELRHEKELEEVQAAVDRLMEKHRVAIDAVKGELDAATLRADEAEAALREIDANLKPAQ